MSGVFTNVYVSRQSFNSAKCGRSISPVIGVCTNLFIIGHMCNTRLAVPEVQRQFERDQITQIFVVATRKSSVRKARILQVLTRIRGEVWVVLQVSGLSISLQILSSFRGHCCFTPCVEEALTTFSRWSNGAKTDKEV